MKAAASGIGVLMLILFVLAGAGCPVRAAIIPADSEADLSNTHQGANGFQYGYYDVDDVTGSFSTDQMFASGSGWAGPASFNTPLLNSATFFHPSVSGGGFPGNLPAVRRYTMGSSGEPASYLLSELCAASPDQHTTADSRGGMLPAGRYETHLAE